MISRDQRSIASGPSIGALGCALCFVVELGNAKATAQVAQSAIAQTIAQVAQNSVAQANVDKVMGKESGQDDRLSIERIVGEPSLGGSTPRGLKFSPDGESVLFLRGKADKSEQLDLYRLDLSSLRESLLVDSERLQSTGELSDAEKSRRERMRIASLSGIVDYFVAPNGQQILLPANGDWFLYDVKKQQAELLLAAKDGAVIDAKFSPKGNFVSFVREQNLYALRLKDRQTLTLSSDGGGLISNGLAEFVAQEEMGRFSGYWWAPDESGIAMQRTDESPVPVAKRFEIYADRTEVIEQRYPAAGTQNAEVQLFWIPLNNPNERIELTLNFPDGSEAYLARVNFTPDSKAVWVQRQNRNQQRLELLSFAINPFAINQKTSQAIDKWVGKLVLAESSPTYVNLHNDLRFVDDGKRFLWSSERDGYNHLYRYALDGSLQTQLTQGDWQVDELLAVDRDSVTFSGNVGDAKQKHLYRISWTATVANAKPLRISKGEGTHNAVFNTQGSRYLGTFSDVLTPPQVRLHDGSGKTLKVISANAVDASHPLKPYLANLDMPEFGTFKTGDQELEYRLFKPKDFDASKRYPVLIYTYGGPHVQVLSRAFDARWGMLLQTFAQQGMLVFSVDNRGSDRRGKRFEEAIYQEMGSTDVADQIAGAKWLGEQGFVDPKRIAIMGWSYGGYMSAQVWVQGGPLIRAAISGAPVSDWSLYDTHYTERYMNLPSVNVEGYAQSTVFRHLDQHPLKGRLLLIHGMADDNVLFTHSTQLMSELQKRGIGFDLMTYPGMKHGPASMDHRRHVYQGMLEFLRRELALESAK